MSFESHIQSMVNGLLELTNITQSDLEKSLFDFKCPIDPEHAPQHTQVRPYARRVLFANDRLEVMLASWRRGHPCAPHDHGPSDSAIKVLQGCSHHKGYAIRSGQLVEVFSERKSVGEILLCHPFQIHAMGDDNATEPLVTLHLYAGSINDMLVFSDSHTHLVTGQAGAWLPVDSSEYLLVQQAGHYSRADLRLV